MESLAFTTVNSIFSSSLRGAPLIVLLITRAPGVGTGGAISSKLLVISTVTSDLDSILALPEVTLASEPVVISAYFVLAPFGLYVSVTLYFFPAPRPVIVYVYTSLPATPVSCFFHWLSPVPTFSNVRSGTSITSVESMSFTTVNSIVSRSLRGAPLIVLLITSDPGTFS